MAKLSSREEFILAQRRLQGRINAIDVELGDAGLDLKRTSQAAMYATGICFAYLLLAGSSNTVEADYSASCALSEAGKPHSPTTVGLVSLAPLVLVVRCLYILGEYSRLMREQLRCSVQLSKQSLLFEQRGPQGTKLDESAPTT